MKNLCIALLLLMVGAAANSQVTKVSLQASGLTCSMCSKAVKNALEKVSFVDNVQVDMKSQEYNLSFKKDAAVNFDALAKAVQDAGFSVAALKVTAAVNSIKLAKDEHITIGDQHFHFLNASNQTLNGTVSFSVVDKGFVNTKTSKKYASLSTMPCVQTGRMAACCPADAASGNSRIYHVII